MNKFSTLLSQIKYPTLPPSVTATSLVMSPDEFATVVEALRTCAAIEQLREEDGATVLLCCDNPEPETRNDQNKVVVNNSLTN